MALRKIKNQPSTLIGSPISIYYDSDYSEYQVKIKGQPDATYFTNDKNDALSTAQLMRNTLLGPKQNPAPKRKTSARTQSAAEAYVRRPSQITKKAPTPRLKKRRTINLQTPRGVFPNPIKKKVIARPRKAKDIGASFGTVYKVESSKNGVAWKIEGVFPNEKSAREYATAKDIQTGHKNWYRVTV